MQIQRRFIRSHLMALVLAIGFTLPPLVKAATYEIDAVHSSVTFEIDHLVVSTVTGRFDKFAGTFEVDDKSGALIGVTGTIEAASINTNQSKRDEHLRSPDFFDVKKFPQLKFTSEPFKIKSNDDGKIPGTLEIHGVSKPVKWEADYKGTAKDLGGNEKAGFKARLKINRKDFGLAWNKALEAGGVLVGEEVSIQLAVQGLKKK